MSIYVTADPHGEFRRIKRYAKENELTLDDVIIVLGDAGANYFLGERDRQSKKLVAKIPATILCIHGNHEARPASLPEIYREHKWMGGTVYVEDEFPNLLFAKDGSVFKLDGKSFLAIGGAYSVDKRLRLQMGWSWFEDEQPDDGIKANVEDALDARGWEVDYVLSHTCPSKYEPVEAYMDGIDQSAVDKSTEEWLDWVEGKLDYGLWYIGHWHIVKDIDRIRFRFFEVEPLEEVIR